MRPLRRRPAALRAEPVLHAPAPGGATGQAGTPSAADRAETAPAVTDDTGSLSAPGAGEADVDVLRRVRDISARLALPRPRPQASPRRGPGEIVSRRWSGASDDLDLDRTLERLVQDRRLEDEQVVVREQLRSRRAVVLLVDISGSMKGERLRTAAATVGALAGQLRPEDLAVVAFWSDAVLLDALGRATAPALVLEELLRTPAQGLTNVSFPLQVAAQQLAGSQLRHSRVLLLSDCVHNAGPDPRLVAGRLPRLDVLLDTSGEHDLDLARDLAAVGRGRLALAAHHRNVAPGLERLFRP